MTDDTQTDCTGCAHIASFPPPPFDEDAARGLSAEEVRKRWPRRHTACVSCGARAIRYASAMHYVMGDW